MQNTIKRGSSASLTGLVREHYLYFFSVTLTAVALRLLFILKFPELTPDSLLYADMAKNWLQHGIFGMTDDNGIVATSIRLPGYPGFLAAHFAIFGADRYGPVRLTQLILDVGACFAVADIARRVASVRAAQIAFLLAALCPSTANYVAVALTETPTIFLTALAFASAVAALQKMEEGRTAWGLWASAGGAIGAAILMRPDSGLLLIVIGGYLLVRLIRSHKGEFFKAGVVLSLVSLAPLIPWTARNWIDFHRFDPLPSVTAATPGEFVAYGFFKWESTWVADYSSVEDIGFHVDGQPIRVQDLPSRAFDNADERRRVEELFNAYSDNGNAISPEMDAGFAALARERIARKPLRQFLWLPALRVLSMWLRPRTEQLPLDSHWWRFAEDRHDSVIATLLGLVNLLFLLPALWTIAWLVWSKSMRLHLPYAGMLLAYPIARTLLLAGLSNPEPRYMLECYPIMFVIGAAGLSRVFAKQQPQSRTS